MQALVPVFRSLVPSTFCLFPAELEERRGPAEGPASRAGARDGVHTGKAVYTADYEGST